MPPQRIEVIRTGVDATGEFDPAAVRPVEGVGSAAPAILWPGRLVEQKDPLLTLDVAELLRGRGAAFELHMVGDGWMREEVHRRADELELRDVVRFHPPTQEIARWLRGGGRDADDERLRGRPVRRSTSRWRWASRSSRPRWRVTPR